MPVVLIIFNYKRRGALRLCAQAQAVDTGAGTSWAALGGGENLPLIAWRPLAIIENQPQAVEEAPAKESKLMTQHLKIAKLDEEAVARIEALEKALDKHIMAFDEPLSFAMLSREQLQQIRELEQDLGVTLVVYDD